MLPLGKRTHASEDALQPCRHLRRLEVALGMQRRACACSACSARRTGSVQSGQQWGQQRRGVRGVRRRRPLAPVRGASGGRPPDDQLVKLPWDTM